MIPKNNSSLIDINKMIEIYLIIATILVKKNHPKLNDLVNDWKLGFSKIHDYMESGLASKDLAKIKSGVKQGLGEIHLILKSILEDDCTSVLNDIEASLGFSIDCSSAEILSRYYQRYSKKA